MGYTLKTSGEGGLLKPPPSRHAYGLAPRHEYGSEAPREASEATHPRHENGSEYALLVVLAFTRYPLRE